MRGLDKLQNAENLIANEFFSAIKKHPDFPKDTIHQVAIMIEEAGEAMQAALDHVYFDGNIEKLRKELAQTGAMCMHCLINLPEE